MKVSILAAGLAIFVYGMTAALLGVLLPGLSARFSLSPKQNGTLAWLQGLGLIAASLAAGPLVSKAQREERYRFPPDGS